MAVNHRGNGATRYDVGMLVCVAGNKVGTIRWKGYPKFARRTGDKKKNQETSVGKVADTLHYGIELSVGKGDCDGKVDGRRYFKCSTKRGIFVTRKHVLGKPFDDRSERKRMVNAKRRTSLLISGGAPYLTDNPLSPTEAIPDFEIKFKEGDKVGVYCRDSGAWFEDGVVREVSEAEDKRGYHVDYDFTEIEATPDEAGRTACESRWVLDLDIENHIRQPGPKSEDTRPQPWRSPKITLPEPPTEADSYRKRYKNADQVQTLHPNIAAILQSHKAYTGWYTPAGQAPSDRREEPPTQLPTPQAPQEPAASDEITGQWQHQHSGSWKDFDEETNMHIERRYQSKDQQVTLGAFEYNFTPSDSPMMRSLEDGSERPIRRLQLVTIDGWHVGDAVEVDDNGTWRRATVEEDVRERDTDGDYFVKFENGEVTGCGTDSIRGLLTQEAYREKGPVDASMESEEEPVEQEG